MLFHGTSETRAKRIINEGIRPASLTGQTSVANPKQVYLIDSAHHAMFFAFGRVMGTYNNGRFDIKYVQRGKRYEHAVVFVIDPDALTSALIHPDPLFTLGGVTYDGVVPPSAVVKMLKIPVTKRLERFIYSVHVAGEPLARYIGMDLNKHLRIRQFDIVERRAA